MNRKLSLALVMLAAPALGGCALQAALIAADVVQDIPRTKGPPNAHLKPAATQACTQRAAQHGTPYIVDVEQRYTDLLIVWGSVTDAQQVRRTFECRYTNAVTSFTLRDIAPTR